MRKLYRFFHSVFLCSAIALVGCDLKPKIKSIPDSIGEFISQRYPALLADPVREPEIYNSAVTDYGVYASPELYGSDKTDYLIYADVDDYKFTSQNEQEFADVKLNEQKTEEDYLIVPDYVTSKTMLENTSDSDFVTVARGDTLYSIAKKNNTSVTDLAKINSINEPYTLSIGQKIKIRSISQPAKIEPAKSVAPKIEKEIVKSEPVKNDAPKPAQAKRVAIQEIVVAPGDTLYSLSRKYEIPVNDLAVMNKISSPFTLSVGQKLKVPKIDNIKAVDAKDVKPVKTIINTKSDVKQTAIVPREAPNAKISSDPKKQLPTITARSNTKFSWPIRGKVLSQYGAKNGGLFNDGINIAGNIGAPVMAAENGVVAYAGNEVKGMGNLIIMQHSDGWMTVYAHLDSMSVRRGNKVVVGQQIGKIGKTGKVDSPQLHFEIRKGTKAYNPMQYLKK